MNTERGEVGFDLDGVIASEMHLQGRFVELLRNQDLIRQCQSHAKLLLRPTQGTIISCRQENERQLTGSWLRDNGIGLPLILCRDAEEKALHINRLQLTRYFENDMRVAHKLQALCPRTRIILKGEIRGSHAHHE